MTHRTPRERYLTDEYEQKLANLADDYPDEKLTRETAIEVFLRECENFREFFSDDAPLPAIRRSALMKTQRILPE